MRLKRKHTDPKPSARHPYRARTGNCGHPEKKRRKNGPKGSHRVRVLLVRPTGKRVMVDEVA